MHKIIKINLPIVFHYYKNHKENLTELRAWFIARHILDTKGEGHVCINQLSHCSGLTVDYLTRICRKSELFREVNSSAYYLSEDKIKQIYKLRNGKIRGENTTVGFTEQFKSNKKFKGYISKCYVEIDLNEKFKKKITKGRISFQAIANYFEISRGTAKSNIKTSTAKINKNIRQYPDIQFNKKNDFGVWFLHNMESKVGEYTVSGNPKSYRLRFQNGTYILIQELPHIYKFTGVFLVNERRKWGNAKHPRTKDITPFVHRKNASENLPPLLRHI